MLLDTDAGQKLAAFGVQNTTNRSVLQDLKKWVTEFMDRIRRFFKNAESDSLAAKEFNRFDQKTKQALAKMFVDMSVDAGEKLSTIKEAGMTKKITTGKGGVKYKFGVTQADIDAYIDAAYENNNSKDYVKYAVASDRLIGAVSGEIDITGYAHALRDNDIRHIRNSHGEKTNEKYPVTKGDLAMIPYIVENYDKVYVKTNSQGEPGIVYVKVGENDVVYYVEAVTTVYHNEKLLVNKQMIKTGYEDIPNLRGLIEAINKKESSSQYLADLQEIRKAYAQGVKENYSKNSISNPEQNVNNESADVAKMPHKLPVSRDVADREQLVDLFEQMVTSSSDYKVLENYRKRLDEMLAIEAQLDRLGAEIRKLSFAEGPRDMEYLNKLKLLQKKAINRLNAYDNKLLGLEKSGVLKAMVERYRKQITQDSFDRAKSYYQERNERRENEIRQYYRESRRQAVEWHGASLKQQRLSNVF